jgi:phage tail sheath protein FI
MALSTPSESPAVVVKEIDLTGGVPNVQSTTGATVINSRWGPVEQRVLVSNEADFVEKFGSPDTSTATSFHRANMFLKYSSKLQVVRVIDGTAKNATATTRQSGLAGKGVLPTSLGEVAKNETDFNAQRAALDSDLHTFVGKYPGALGNSLRVSLCPYDSSGAAFSNWAYKGEFDAAPGTSSFATKKGASNDEVHAVVVDNGGLFSGTKGTVLERYAFLSLGSNAKDDAGSNIYIKDVINDASQYVWMIDFDSDFQNTSVAGTQAAAGTTIDNGDNFKRLTGTTTTAPNYDFDSGVNVASLSAVQTIAGYDLFSDKDQVEIDFILAPGASTRSDQTTVTNDLVAKAVARKDCVVVSSPARSDIVNINSAATITTNIVATADTFTKSSYLVMDGNYLKIFDKFNDRLITIPASSSTAGIMAATDLNRAPWFSPAGSRRGQYLGITSIPYSPTKAQRDTLYKAQVNPIANIPGAGVILFGDKTKLARPSAFDRINVRRLFLVLERAISRAAEQVLFEFNDEFTRAEFVNIVEPVLREVKGRRGITDFRVVADETNNTPAVIDRNEFIASIFIKPARSINFVTLNFVAVRTGVDFEEVVGTV